MAERAKIIEADRASWYKPDSLPGPLMTETRELWLSVHGRRIYCRLHRPTDNERLPLLVYLHGGGWVMGSVDTHDRSAREYAAAGNVAVLMVDYSLAPEAQFPYALEECFGVVQQLPRAVDEWKVDPSRIVLGGDSAGGNLALGTALMLRDRTGPALSGIMAVYPICDADFTRPSYGEINDPEIRLDTQRMQFLWDCYAPDEIDRKHPYASPLRGDLTDLPPVLLQLADRDVLRSEGQALHQRLVAAGVNCRFTNYLGVTHGFRRATDTIPAARDAMNEAGEWLRDVCKGTHPSIS